MDQQTKLNRLCHILAEVAGDQAELVERVLAQRTRWLSVVVEDLYQPHNGAAVIRACECFGIQDLYVISKRNPFRVSEEVVAGAAGKVTIHPGPPAHESNTRTVLNGLKDKGYRIAATSLRDGCIPISELDLCHKTAILFGTEEQGLSEEAHQLADVFVRIPMYGFTQSFNISVSAALSLFQLSQRLRSANVPWPLEESEKMELRLQWLAQTVPDSTPIIAEYCRVSGLDPNLLFQVG